MKLKNFTGLFLALALMILGVGADARAEPASSPGASAWAETEQTAMRLIAATETTGAAKQTTLGLHFKLKPGWKIYWRSPGDAGFPPQPDWSKSENLKSATLQWPAPTRFSILGLETLGYKDEVVLPMTVERLDASKPLSVAGTVRYLTCSDICIPYDAEVALTLAVGGIDAPAKPSRFAHLINRYQVNVPGPGSRHGLTVQGAETWTAGKDTFLRVTLSSTMALKKPDLFPDGSNVLVFSKPTVDIDPDGLKARLTVKAFGASEITGPNQKSLVGQNLTLTVVDGKRSAEKKFTVTAALGGVAPVTEKDAATPIIVILALAVLGGLILNLMPCVLPVLSIKLLSVVGHGGGERRLVRMSFLASAAGIVFAFLVLAGVLIALKSGGMIVGWGIQFQQPWFLIAMTVLVVAFACNLWGLFEVRLPEWVSDLGEHASHVHGLGGHFLQGTFATLLATPCSAPFLGTAVGFALARGGLEISAVFAALGIGLALPYLAVATFPGLATRLPRPGPWMITLKRVLSLALVATGVWLLSVLAATVGIKAATAVGVLAAAGTGLLVLSRLVPKGGGRRVPLGIVLAVVAAFLVPNWLGTAPGDGARANGSNLTPYSGTGELDKLWTPLDEAAIPGLVAGGKTIFVDVTADWCITCLVNKGLVLNTDAMLKVFKADSVVMMQADWTKPDPIISAYLARHQRYGIPFNIVYGPGAPDGIVLAELLSQDEVQGAFRRASKSVKISKN
ncbi:MAG: thioredoxin family protein [Rhodospirillales bacterium]|nr:thioredoxin family protein [Rhodospirillales bacterium]